MSNFLQDHYNRAMDAGGGHAMYVVINDIDDETAKRLSENYRTRPAAEAPDTQEKAALEAAMQAENDRYKSAAVFDDLAWMTGTGRYAQ